MPQHRHEVGNVYDEGSGSAGNRGFGTTYGRGSTRTGQNVGFGNANNSLNFSALTSYTGSSQAHNHGWSGSASSSFSGNSVTPSYSGSATSVVQPYVALNYIIRL